MSSDNESFSSASPPPSGDDEMARYLADVQLHSLDLGDVELEEPKRPPSRLALGVAAALALAHGLGTAMFPWTVVYQLRSYGETVWLSLLAIEALLLAYLIRGLRQVLKANPPVSRAAEKVQRAPDGTVVSLSEDGQWVELDPTAEPAAVEGWAERVAALWRAIEPWQQRASAMSAQYRLLLLFGSIFCFGILLTFVLPREAQWSGGTYSVLWFVTVAIATGTGILVGRFIMAAGEQVPAESDAPLPPIQFPPWMRWFNLALLVLGASVATFGPSLINASGPSDDFGFAIVGLITGICGAIWIARRFDEWEVGFRQEAEQKARSPLPESVPTPPTSPFDDAAER